MVTIPIDVITMTLIVTLECLSWLPLLPISLPKHCLSTTRGHTCTLLKTNFFINLSMSDDAERVVECEAVRRAGSGLERTIPHARDARLP